MAYLADRLSTLRQEIEHLQNMNTRYCNQSTHSLLDRSALELRSVRLLQIKNELASMRHRSNDSEVWWEKHRIA
jgi:hypothetical protein